MRVYVDWHKHRVLSEEGLQDEIAEYAQELRKDRSTMSDFVVNKDYEADLLGIILDRNEAAMEQIEQEYKEWCLEAAEEAVLEEYDGCNVDD